MSKVSQALPGIKIIIKCMSIAWVDLTPEEKVLAEPMLAQYEQLAEQIEKEGKK